MEANVKPGTRKANGQFAKGINQTLENNGCWKGDAARTDTKRQRAQRLVPVLGMCERCDRQATDRHHKDGDPGNNDLANIETLCRRCHMLADGRLAKLQAMNKSPEMRWARQKGGSK